MSNKSLTPNYLLIHDFITEYPGEERTVQTMMNCFTSLPTMLLFMRHQREITLHLNTNDNAEYTAKNFRGFELHALDMDEVIKAL